MNVRTLLIIAGLALPVVAFTILSQSTPQTNLDISDLAVEHHKENKPIKTQANSAPVQAPNPSNPDAGQIPKGVKPGPMSVPPVVLPPIGEKNKTAQPSNKMTLEQAISKTKSRLEYLNKLHPGEWPEERKRHRNAPPTLQQAKDYNRNRLLTLSKLTEAEWNQRQRAAEQRARARWQSLTPEQKMEAFRNSQR